MGEHLKLLWMELGGLAWLARGRLCPVLGHKRIATDPAWVSQFGPQICEHCWTPLV